jgi:hypothetical protein
MSNERPARLSTLRLRQSVFKSKQSVTNVIIGLFSIVFGFLISVFINEALLIKYNNLIIGLIVLVFCAIALLYFTDTLEQVRDTHKEVEGDLNAIDDKWNALDKVPSLVTFLERTDTIKVTDAGDGIFESFYQVEYNSDDDAGIHHLHFPVILDLVGMEEESGGNVEVQSILVDGVRKSTHDAYSAREIRKPHNPNRGTLPQEYGIVNVPVELNSQHKRAAIILKVKYKSIFKSHRTGDYVIVDIPYVTKELNVSIHAENNNSEVVPSPGPHTIEAKCEMMELEDRIEEIHQLPNVSNKPKSIEWHTKNAKIGYRYRLHFQVVDAEDRPQS